MDFDPGHHKVQRVLSQQATGVATGENTRFIIQGEATSMCKYFLFYLIFFSRSKSQEGKYRESIPKMIERNFEKVYCIHKKI